MDNSVCKHCRDYSLGDWLLLFLSIIIALFLNNFVYHYHFARLSASFWVFIFLISLALAYINRPAKQKAISYRAMRGNWWVAFSAIPYSHMTMLILAISSLVITFSIGESLLWCLNMCIGLISLYIGFAISMSEWKESGIKLRDLLNSSPSKLVEAFSNVQKARYKEHVLKLSYAYQDAFQIVLASFSELRTFQIECIDEVGGQIVVISRYKSFKDQTIAVYLQGVSNEETLVSIKVQSLGELDSPISAIAGYLNGFNCDEIGFHGS